MNPGRALAPYYGCAVGPAVDNACTSGRTMTTGAASVRSAGRSNAGERENKNSD
jgi:hypothetical protein